VAEVIQTVGQPITDIEKNWSVDGTWQIPKSCDKVDGVAGDYINGM
jgi:hypothetical protein